MHRSHFSAVTVALFAVGMLVTFGDRAAGQLPVDESVAESKRVALDWIESNADTLREVNRNIWTYAEIGLQESELAALRAAGTIA